MRSWAGFCAVGAAALFACLLAQLGELVPELGELLVLRGAEVAHTLFPVGSLTFGVRPGCVAFDDRCRLRELITDLEARSLQAFNDAEN